MTKINANKVGLIIGGLCAIWHIMWVVLIYAGVAKPLLEWILKIHSLNFQFEVLPFDLFHSLTLIVLTGVVGYAIGFLVAWLWNLTQ